MKLTVLAAVGLLGISAPAIAASGHCHDDMKAVEAALPGAKLSDAYQAKVKAALVKAGELHKANKDEDCEKSLVDTQKLLNLKEGHKH